MNKWMLSTLISISAISSISASDEISDSDANTAQSLLESFICINQKAQECIMPPEHGTTIDKKALYQMRQLSLGAIYRIDIDPGISNINERYRDLGRRINARQVEIKEEISKIQKSAIKK